MNDKPALLKNVGATAECDRDYADRNAFESQRAIGARCTVKRVAAKQMADVGKRRQLFFYKSSFTLYFGLGKADKVERIEVRWPGAKRRRGLEVARIGQSD